MDNAECDSGHKRGAGSDYPTLNSRVLLHYDNVRLVNWRKIAISLLKTPQMPDNPDLVPGQRIKLSTHMNELVRFKLHELADMKEGIIRAIDQQGYWIEGGSLAEYLRKTSPGAD